MRKVYTYYNGKASPVNDFFNKADVKIKDKFKFCLEYIKDNRNVLNEPYVRHFSGGKFSKLYEVRVMALNRMVRIIFCENNNEIIFLHAFYKKTLKDTKMALDTALKILDKITDKDGAVLGECREELVFND